MSTTTTNLGLIKPELTDVADITMMNTNWDKIDTKIKEMEDNINNKPKSEFIFGVDENGVPYIEEV